MNDRTWPYAVLYEGSDFEEIFIPFAHEPSEDDVLRSCPSSNYPRATVLAPIRSYKILTELKLEAKP